MADYSLTIGDTFVMLCTFTPGTGASNLLGVTIISGIRTRLGRWHPAEIEEVGDDHLGFKVTIADTSEMIEGEAYWSARLENADGYIISSKTRTVDITKGVPPL